MIAALGDRYRIEGELGQGGMATVFLAEFVAALEAEGRDARPFSVVAARFIAVLPFVNASPDAENEYLSDGITDELINALAKVEGLRVAARTSVFALKGKPQGVARLPQGEPHARPAWSRAEVPRAGRAHAPLAPREHAPGLRFPASP